jgi:hypothetical protein
VVLQERGNGLNQEIFRAIRGRNLIEFNYEGHHRVVEPHVYGRHDGTEQLLGFQIWGSSTSGGLPDWRRFNLAGISGLIVLAEGFTDRKPAQSGTQGDWDEIYMTVE